MVDYRDRPITPSDYTDVEIISAYLPCVVLATDNFMANLARNLKLDTKYDTTIFCAKRESLPPRWIQQRIDATSTMENPPRMIALVPGDSIDEAPATAKSMWLKRLCASTPCF